MSDLAAFLSARLDEDEATAGAATPGPWAAVPYVYGPPDEGWGEPGNWEIEAPNGSVVSHQPHEGGGIQHPADAAHIARHDPARVLREVEAKRAIVAWWQRGDRDPPPSPTYENWRKSLSGYQLLLHLAAVYSDHPDYDPSWEPGLRWKDYADEAGWG